MLNTPIVVGGIGAARTRQFGQRKSGHRHAFKHRIGDDFTIIVN
jgi:hypothetical protein